MECLADLDRSLRKENSRLLVLKGNPQTVFPQLFKAWDVKHLAYERDTEPYSISRDAKVSF